MGAFICNNCNESLNKFQQIKKHLIKCKNYLFTCIDCQQIIKYKNVRLHLNCVGGREKEVGIVNYIAMANKQDNKNDSMEQSSTTSQQMDISITSMDTSTSNDKKPDRMEQLLKEIEDEVGQKEEQKLDKKKDKPKRRIHKSSPINPTKLKSKARRKLLQVIPETPEKSQNKEAEDSFEVVKQTPLSKISSENTSLASKLSELLLKEESRLEKSQQRKRKLNFSKEEGNENKIITNREILEQCIRNKNLGEDEDLTKPSSSTTNKRKRHLTPSEISFTNNLKQLSIATKKPRRRLFSSHSSSNNSISFPGQKND
uniref:Uncharacterized protein n=1 Tax=Meloidogyne enterolobii TaxID=390850 RepID=A0A6V7WVS0_MELEN|nr:unnamed protein product [Meloidogyne enterolobii]